MMNVIIATHGSLELELFMYNRARYVEKALRPFLPLARSKLRKAERGRPFPEARRRSK